MYKIARQYGTTIDLLVKANNISNPNLILRGQILIIPGNEKVTYTVKSGDTLWAISRKFNVALNSLIQVNNIKNPNLIYPGEILVIGM